VWFVKHELQIFCESGMYCKLSLVACAAWDTGFYIAASVLKHLLLTKYLSALCVDFFAGSLQRLRTWGNTHLNTERFLPSWKTFCRTCLQVLLFICPCLIVSLSFFQLSDEQQKEFDCNIQHISNSPAPTFPSSWTCR